MLLGRRLLESGVRFVKVNSYGWDSHGDNFNASQSLIGKFDQAYAALLEDLHDRGMLENTLVIALSEFGRTPISEIRNTSDPENAGRDHHPSGYSMWLAGGGIKGGQVIGETDELGFTITKDKVEVHDLQATILHCLGLDHHKLTYRHMGRDFRLTDVHGNVVKAMLA